ncbi:MAG TPA: ribonuclease III [Candidatus Avipropionibacterium avicola]|uniref:Ribonuclease 3 n=1 Tax=Candidatus Avipropionibacterium avicola TaxID=2840701 RepID=A0A9D1GZE9_9ACTN|nr:ribonuclease III [Candidatus Avipropionibacterium avicola]
MSGRLTQLLADLDIELPAEDLELAFVHRSYAYEHGGLDTNERLEFLGDSVLGVVVTEYLYRKHPDMSEGQLARLRSAVVNSRALASVARGLGLGQLVRLGKGEEATGGRDKNSILADTTEALIGAIFLSAGNDAAARFVHHLFDPLSEHAATLGAGLDWKTSLQEQTSLAGLPVPHYTVVADGPDHAKSFEATVHIGERSFGPGSGTNKKDAEQDAAEQAFGVIKALADQVLQES